MQINTFNFPFPFILGKVAAQALNEDDVHKRGKRVTLTKPQGRVESF
jgi:hypothetical protein